MVSGRWIWGGLAGAVVACGAFAGLRAAAVPEDAFDLEPVAYSKTASADPVAKLKQRLDSGEVKLSREPERGYLLPVLRALGLNSASQMLVFSKTSFQRDRISPSSPRALYFNDQAWVGYVQGGGYLELAGMDPQLGAVFYVLDQESEQPKLIRQNYECLSCHGSTLSNNVPGWVMRSVFTARDGQPLLTAGTYLTSDQSPMKERWGGWYVTGTHGVQRHMGNLTAKNADDAETMDRDPGANLTDLKGRIATGNYLTPYSDIVALTVAEHQTRTQNLISAANQETRRALHFEKLLNKDLGRPAAFRSESTTSRIRSVCEPLVQALFFCGEAPLTDPVKGTSGYAAVFEKQGPRDSKGRSLRQLDLTRRLMRYPLSYLVYSEAFDGLPAEARDYVRGRVRDVLAGKDASEPFRHLTAADRTAITEILRETKPELAPGE